MLARVVLGNPGAPDRETAGRPRLPVGALRPGAVRVYCAASIFASA